jgi:hypothetical protein
MSNERKLEEQISEVANKQLRREQLLEQRIKNLERRLEMKEVNNRLTNLESFKSFVIVLSAVVLIYKMFA